MSRNLYICRESADITLTSGNFSKSLRLTAVFPEAVGPVRIGILILLLAAEFGIDLILGKLNYGWAPMRATMLILGVEQTFK